MTPLAQGAEEIAKAVGIKVWTVYNLRRKKDCPIQNKPGIGLVADPEQLKAWILGQPEKDNIP